MDEQDTHPHGTLALRYGAIRETQDEDEIRRCPIERLWTVVDDPDDHRGWIALPGYRRFNRLCNLITEKPRTSEAEWQESFYY